MKKIKLFCLPWAGGNAISFNKFKKRLRPDIELQAVEYAGHGTRSSEPLYQDMGEAVDDIYSLLSRSIGDGPYALFGHSMGAEIAYELYHKIADEDGHMNLPVHMFFSARKAPHVNNGTIRYHALPHHQFKEEITKLNGIPDFVKESDEVFDFLAPVILSDCRLIENHCYREKQTLISCGITVIYGSRDAMTEGTTGHEWAFHSADQCSVFHIDANHFFVMDKCKEIADIINAVLQMWGENEQFTIPRRSNC